MFTNRLCEHARDRARDRACACARARRAPIPSHLPCLSPPQPLIVERRCGRPAGSIRVGISTRREPLVFEQNNGYTTRGRRGRGRALIQMQTT